MIRLLRILAVLAVLLAPSLAAAQSLCGDRGALLRHLERNFGERPVAMGVAADGGAVLELVMTPSGSSWTVLMTLPSGLSCVVATGEHWQAVAPPPAAPRPDKHSGALRAPGPGTDS